MNLPLALKIVRVFDQAIGDSLLPNLLGLNPPETSLRSLLAFILTFSGTVRRVVGQCRDCPGTVSWPARDICHLRWAVRDPTFVGMPQASIGRSYAPPGDSWVLGTLALGLPEGWP